MPLLLPICHPGALYLGVLLGAVISWIPSSSLGPPYWLQDLGEYLTLPVSHDVSGSAVLDSPRLSIGHPSLSLLFISYSPSFSLQVLKTKCAHPLPGLYRPWWANYPNLPPLCDSPHLGKVLSTATCSRDYPSNGVSCLSPCYTLPQVILERMDLNCCPSQACIFHASYKCTPEYDSVLIYLGITELVNIKFMQ